MFREINTFVAVCRTGTFTAAGERLGLTQSAVSDHIGRLEAFVGVRLFYRTGRSATLNAAGQELLPLAEQAAQLVDQMRRRPAAGPIRGSIRVGTITSLHNTLVTRAMIAFRETHPLVTIRLVRHEDSMLGQIAREELDLAVQIQPATPLPPTMQWYPLLRKAFVLIAPATTTAKDWRDALQIHPLLRYDESTASGRQIDAFLRRMDITVIDSLWINYLDTMIAMASHGIGAAIIPSTSFGIAAPKLRVFELGTDTFYREIGVVCRRRGPTSSLIPLKFVEALERAARAEPFSSLPVDSSEAT